MLNVLKLAALISNQRLILPFYHAVSDTPPAHIKHLYTIRSVENFASDMDFLLRVYEPISMKTLIAYVKGEARLPKYAFLLSFDDGLREFAQCAWPVLKQKKISAALFVNPAFIDSNQLFFRLKASLLIDLVENTSKIDFNRISEVIKKPIANASSLKQFIREVNYGNKHWLDNLAAIFSFNFESYTANNKPYLSLQELQELANQGVTIGAHSMDHPLFHKLDPEQQINQFTQSMHWVQRHLNPEQHVFSFPFTDYGMAQAFFNKMQNSEVNLDASFGTAGLKKENLAFHFQRIPVEDYTLPIQKILVYQYLYYFAKAPFFKNTIKR